MNRKVLITASTGNIGSQIIANLGSLDQSFVAGINSKTLKEGETSVDFNDEEGLVKAFTGMDTVFLLFPLHPNMVDWAKNAITAAKKAMVNHLVRSSGAGANSSSPYYMPKIQGEIDDIIRESGIAYTITQPSSFMQNFVNFYAHDIKNGTVRQPVGNGKIGWVDVRDIASVNTQILVDPERFVNQELTITGNENLSYGEALSIIADTIHRPLNFTDIPSENAIAAMKEIGMSQFNIQMLSSLNEIIKAGYAEGTTSTVVDVTGKEPISFSQFANDYKDTWL